jgi:hypothetical protein
MVGSRKGFRIITEPCTNDSAWRRTASSAFLVSPGNRPSKLSTSRMAASSIVSTPSERRAFNFFTSTLKSRAMSRRDSAKRKQAAPQGRRIITALAIDRCWHFSGADTFKLFYDRGEFTLKGGGVEGETLAISIDDGWMGWKVTLYALEQGCVKRKLAHVLFLSSCARFTSTGT